MATECHHGSSPNCDRWDTGLPWSPTPLDRLTPFSSIRSTALSGVAAATTGKTTALPGRVASGSRLLEAPRSGNPTAPCVLYVEAQTQQRRSYRRVRCRRYRPCVRGQVRNNRWQRTPGPSSSHFTSDTDTTVWCRIGPGIYDGWRCAILGKASRETP